MDSGRFSYVSSQLAMIPSSRSLLSRDKRLPLDTWNTFGVIIFLHVIHPEIILKELTVVQHRGEQGSVPQALGTGTSFARDEERNRGTIPMPTLARRPLTISPFIPVAIPQNSIVGQQRQQISELPFDKLPTPQSFYVGK